MIPFHTPPNASKKKKPILGRYSPSQSIAGVRCIGLARTLSRSLTLGLLGVATNNLDLVGGHGLASRVHLERHVLDEERPDFVAESVRVEAPLRCPLVKPPPGRSSYLTHLELESRLDVLLERFRDGLVKVAQDLHGELRVDALVADEVVERVRQSEADATVKVSLACRRAERVAVARSAPHLLRRYSS